MIAFRLQRWLARASLLIALAAVSGTAAGLDFFKPLNESDLLDTVPNETNCPEGKSFQCDDGSCVRNPNACPHAEACPAEASFRCSDGSCVRGPYDCQSGILKCPPNRPYQCPNGDCVAGQGRCP